MPDFQHVPAPVFPPGTCRGCSTHADKGGFVDLLADDSAGFHLYLCAACVETAGRLVGMLPADPTARLRAMVAEQEQRIEALEQLLERERDNKVVSLADARELLKPNRPARQGAA